MKCAVVLTAVEELILHQLAINRRHRDIRRRVAAGMLIFGQRIKVIAIAERLGVSD